MKNILNNFFAYNNEYISGWTYLLRYFFIIIIFFAISIIGGGVFDGTKYESFGLLFPGVSLLGCCYVSSILVKKRSNSLNWKPSSKVIAIALGFFFPILSIIAVTLPYLYSPLYPQQNIFFKWSWLICVTIHLTLIFSSGKKSDKIKTID